MDLVNLHTAQDRAEQLKAYIRMSWASVGCTEPVNIYFLSIFSHFYIYGHIPVRG